MKQSCRAFPAAACRLLALLLCAMLFPCISFAEGDRASTLEKYLSVGYSMQNLFDAAGKALDRGADPKDVLEDMTVAANELDALDFLNCAVENVMADANPETQMLRKLADSRRLRVEMTGDYTTIGKPFYRIYDTPEVTDAVREMLSSVKGNVCLQPAYWTESDFSSVFGVKPDKFKPAAPRPGYVCIVLKDKSQSAPEQDWKGDPDNLTDVLEHLLDDLMMLLGDDQPVLTGNPQLASSFWFIDLKYPLRGRYGEDGAIKGYNVSLELTVQGAGSRKKIAELKHTEILPNRISEWSNWIAKAKFPRIYSSNADEFMAACTKWASSVRPQLQQERSSAIANTRISALNTEKILNALLVKQTEKLNDGWQKAIYADGAKNVSLEDGAISFTLRSYNLKLSELGDRTAENSEKWLQKALENAGNYDLEITLPLEDGLVSQKGMNVLRQAVQKAAAAAKKDFGSKDVTAALKEAFFPVPYEGQLKEASQLKNPTEAFTAWYAHNNVLPGYDVPDQVAAAAFALRTVQNVNLQGGPHAITLNCVGGSLNDIVSDSISAVVDKQAYLPASKRASVSDPGDTLLDVLLENTVSSVKKAKAKAAVSVDLDDLAQQTLPVEYRKLFSDFRWEDQVDALSDTLSSLPEEAAESFPKHGIISGGKKGTSVTFRPTGQVWPTYLLMRNTSTNRIAVTCMIHPKKNVTVRVPKGFYEIVWCSGPYWYGTEKLFGSLGSYSKSEATEILGSNMRHTIDLITAKQDGIPVHSADPDDFR